MSFSSKGNITPTKTIKAGCGIRYDPDDLGEEAGFDFSDAVKLKNEVSTKTLSHCTDNTNTSNTKHEK